MGRKSLCAFCEGEMLGSAVEPEREVVALPPNTPQANRFRVTQLGYAGRSNSLGRKTKTF